MIERLNGKVVYENNWMRVEEDEVKFSNGHQDIFGVVRKPDFAVVIPMNDQGEICMVNQFRYPIGRRSWELPMGTSATDPNILAEDLARAELKEETGLLAKTIEKVGQIDSAPGFCSQIGVIFLAKDLTQTENALELTEADLIAEWKSLEQITLMIRNGDIQDANTISALSLALHWRA